MTEPRNGPPGKDVSPDASHGARANHRASHDTTTAHNDNRSERQQPFDVLAGNARRYAAARRLTPIGGCGCVRDPDVDRHRHDGEISDHQADAAVAAVELLDSLGTPGLLDTATCQAVWRAGHRRIAVAVHARTTGEAVS